MPAPRARPEGPSRVCTGDSMLLKNRPAPEGGEQLGCGARVLALLSVLTALPFLLIGIVGEYQGGGGGGVGGVGGLGSAPREGQALFRDAITKDRSQLLSGALSYTSNLDTDVGDEVTFTVRLTALDAKGAGKLAKDKPDVQRQFRVGGVQGASLKSSSDDVTVKLLSDKKTQQTIAAPGDEAQWQWSVSASKPDDYDLTLVVTTYQEDSSRALVTLNPPVSIKLTVHNTVRNFVVDAKEWFLAAGSLLVVLAGFFALRGPLVNFVRRKREERQERQARGQDGYM